MANQDLLGALKPTAASEGGLEQIIMPPSVKPGADVWRRFRRNRLAVFGLLVMVIVTFMALAAPILAPMTLTRSADNILQPPSAEHLLGTDDSGRDGTESFDLCVASLACGRCDSLACDGPFGYGNWCIGGRLWRDDRSWLSGLINVMLSIPTIPLAMVLGAFLSKDVIFIVGILFIVSWTATARIIRAEFITLRERDYVWPCVRLVPPKRA